MVSRRLRLLALAMLLASVYGQTGTNQAAMPVMCPPAGSYPVVQRLHISSTTPNTTIYYTTDGTTPAADTSAVFNPAAPIMLNSTTAVAALAVAPGFDSSNVTNATYTITGASLGSKVEPPSFSQPGGNVRIHDKVSISAGNDTDIYWTASQNFSYPTECHWKSKVQGLVIINFGSTTSNQVTISAFAAKNGSRYSDVRSATFKVDVADEDFSIGVGASRIKLKERDEV